MHTIHVKGWSIHHNGDWSGDAIITSHGFAGAPEIKIPGFVLKGIAESICADVVEAARDLVDLLEPPST